ncbi:MAG TPA: 1-acyl-sn-glycerol-3-phosphate acyltransferase [Thermoleophilaceae bacterium]|nr:1-acyl-sn-glycerol-3-phosphate acyltransferase [Thermoleophilaceae bacterium]
MARELSLYHARTRTRGVNPLVYWPTRAVIQPLLMLFFWLKRIGLEHIPSEGGVIVAPNHRSFLDPWVVGVCLRRPVYFVAKRELFEKRWMGWFLNSLGAFPIRRGEADEEAMATARALVERGEAVLIFPEGTRIRRGSLGEPRRGVGRLALETGAPVVPVAVAGTERARRGLIIRPCKVRVRCGRPLTFPHVERPSAHLASEVTARIWPCVQLQYEWLGGTPALRTAAVVGAGPMGTALASLLARAGLEVELGCRTREHADRIAAAGANHERLPGVELPAGVTARPVAKIEFQAVDLVVFAVPSRDLPAAVGDVAARVGRRTAVVVCCKGLVRPFGMRPSEYVAERVLARGVAVLAGPAHAAEAAAGDAALVVAANDPDLRRQLVRILGKAGAQVEETDDVAGAELAACAKNVAALAASAVGVGRLNDAGAAASRVFGEVYALALDEGARPETFAGTAGVGDLVATVIAHGSRNRRAGEMLARGVRPDEIRAELGETPEALDSVSLVQRALEQRELPAPAVTALAALVEGRSEEPERIAAAR